MAQACDRGRVRGGARDHAAAEQQARADRSITLLDAAFALPLNLDLAATRAPHVTRATLPSK